jgi:hypothetical protein
LAATSATAALPHVVDVDILDPPNRVEACAVAKRLLQDVLSSGQLCLDRGAPSHGSSGLGQGRR